MSASIARGLYLINSNPSSWDGQLQASRRFPRRGRQSRRIPIGRRCSRRRVVTDKTNRAALDRSARQAPQRAESSHYLRLRDSRRRLATLVKFRTGIPLRSLSVFRLCELARRPIWACIRLLPDITVEAQTIPRRVGFDPLLSEPPVLLTISEWSKQQRRKACGY